MQSRLFLLRCQVENCRTVLAADIRPLAVQRCGVMNSKKDIQQIIITDFLVVIGDANRLGMAGIIAADIFIAGVFGMTADITDSGGLDTGDFIKRRLNTPKTSGGKNSLG